MKIVRQIYRNFTESLAQRFGTQLRATVTNFVTDQENNPLIQLVADVEGQSKYKQYKSIFLINESISLPIGNAITFDQQIADYRPPITSGVIDSLFYPMNGDIEYLRIVSVKTRYTAQLILGGPGTFNIIVSILNGSATIFQSSVTNTVTSSQQVYRQDFPIDYEIGADGLLEIRNSGASLRNIKVRIRLTSPLISPDDIDIANFFSNTLIEYIRRDGSRMPIKIDQFS